MRHIDEPIDVFLERSYSVLTARGSSKSMLHLSLILDGVWKRTDTDLSFDEWFEHLNSFSKNRKKNKAYNRREGENV